MKRKPRQRSNGFEEWGGYMEAKKSKLINQFNKEAQVSGLKVDDLFKNVSIFVNGFTEPSADELRILMIKHGGEYHHYYKTGKTTHIIATNLPDSKVKAMAQLKVVKPTWITESIKAGKVLNFQDYLLLSNQSVSQPTLTFKAQPKIDNEKSSTGIKTATDEGFLEEFYNNSRLHHISMMGTIFKDYILKLRSDKTHTFPGRDSLVNKIKENNLDCNESNIDTDAIMHIDMDCFFVSVGIRDKPELKGKPVAVTHSKGNHRNHREGVNTKMEVEAYINRRNEKMGKSTTQDQIDNHWVTKLSEFDSMAEIASCSYEARKLGIKNGMFVGPALKLCPDLQFIDYNFDAYKEVSYVLYNTVARYTLDIEAVSCDELYADCSKFLETLDVAPLQFASILRAEIMEQTGCPCSVGFGSNKLLARLATKMAKPNGQFHLLSHQVESFMLDKPVSDLPGVGRSTSYKLKDSGVKTCGDLQNIPLEKLKKEFGNKQGETLYNACRGKVDKSLVFNQIRKSVSADVNYGIRFQNDEDRDIFLKNLSQEVSNRLQACSLRGRNITLKLMVRSKDAPEETAKYLGHGVCDTISKGGSVSTPVYSSESILKEVMKIMKTVNINSKDLRGIGIQITRLEPIKKEGTLMSFINSNSLNKKLDNRSLEKDQINDTTPGNTNSFASDESNLQNQTVKAKSTVPSNITHNLSNDGNASFEGSSGTKDQQLPQTNENDGIKSFVSPSEIRVLLKQWVESEKRPKQRDKTMIIDYLQQLIIGYRFEDLHLILKSFYRCITHIEENSAAWKNIFNDILNKVQEVMVLVHNSRLKVDNCF